MATGPSPPAQTVNSCRQSPALGVRGGEPGRSNQSQRERKKGWEKKGVAWMGLSFPLPFLRSPAPGQGACFPPPAFAAPAAAALLQNWNWLGLFKEKKKKSRRRRRDQSSRQREGGRVHFPPTALGLLPSLSPLQQHQEPQTEPRAAFSTSSVPFPPSVSHTARSEPLPPLDFPSHAQLLVSFQALEIPPSCPRSSMQTGIAMGALQLAGFATLFFLLHSGNTLANKASQGKRKIFPARRVAV